MELTITNNREIKPYKVSIKQYESGTTTLVFTREGYMYNQVDLRQYTPFAVTSIGGVVDMTKLDMVVTDGNIVITWVVQEQTLRQAGNINYQIVFKEKLADGTLPSDGGGTGVFYTYNAILHNSASIDADNDISANFPTILKQQYDLIMNLAGTISAGVIYMEPGDSIPIGERLAGRLYYQIDDAETHDGHFEDNLGNRLGTFTATYLTDANINKVISNGNYICSGTLQNTPITCNYCMLRVTDTLSSNRVVQEVYIPDSNNKVRVFTRAITGVDNFGAWGEVVNDAQLAEKQDKHFFSTEQGVRKLIQKVSTGTTSLYAKLCTWTTTQNGQKLMIKGAGSSGFNGYSIQLFDLAINVNTSNGTDEPQGQGYFAAQCYMHDMNNHRSVVRAYLVQPSPTVCEVWVKLPAYCTFVYEILVSADNEVDVEPVYQASAPTSESRYIYTPIGIANSTGWTASRALVTNSSGNITVSDITSTELNYLDGATSNVQTQLNSKAAKNGYTANRVFVTDSSGNMVVSSITSTELNYLDNVTSNIQTQLNAKQATITGAISDIVNTNLSPNIVPFTDASGKIHSSTVTATELSYLDGVTSAIQTQLNNKQAKITGGATTIATANLTASRALISDASGKVAVSSVTSTQIGYLSGVTSAIQTQLNAKAAKSGYTANVVLVTDASGNIIASSTISTSELNCLNGISSGEGTIETRLANLKKFSAQTGDIKFVAHNNTVSEWLLCDGSAVSRTTYAALFSAIGTTWGSGNGSTTFNLPNLINKTVWGGSSAGVYKTAGLPNITGEVGVTSKKAFAYDATFSGALVKGTSLGKQSGYSSDSSYEQYNLKLDASSSNSIYGASSTVQPPAAVVRPFIKV